MKEGMRRRYREALPLQIPPRGVDFAAPQLAWRVVGLEKSGPRAIEGT